MTTSVFDPTSFLDSQITEQSVKRPPLTAGIELIGIVGEIKARTWQGKKDPTQSGIAMDVPVEFDLTPYPAEVARLGGVTKVVIQDSIMLNLNDNGAIDMAPGKNPRLRQWREALNMNNPGEAFSFRNMQGRAVRAKIKNDAYEGEIYDKIESVARPS